MNSSLVDLPVSLLPYQGDVAQFTDQPDVAFRVTDQHGLVVVYLSSITYLRQVSPGFAQMLRPESLRDEATSCIKIAEDLYETIDVTENHHWFSVFFNILHFKSFEVPKTLKLKELFEMASISARFNSVEAVLPWAEMWIAGLAGRSGSISTTNTADEAIEYWIRIAQTFHDSKRSPRVIKDVTTIITKQIRLEGNIYKLERSKTASEKQSYGGIASETAILVPSTIPEGIFAHILSQRNVYVLSWAFNMKVFLARMGLVPSKQVRLEVASNCLTQAHTQSPPSPQSLVKSKSKSPTLAPNTLHPIKVRMINKMVQKGMEPEKAKAIAHKQYKHQKDQERRKRKLAAEKVSPPPSIFGNLTCLDIAAASLVRLLASLGLLGLIEGNFDEAQKLPIWKLSAIVDEIHVLSTKLHPNCSQGISLQAQVGETAASSQGQKPCSGCPIVMEFRRLKFYDDAFAKRVSGVDADPFEQGIEGGMGSPDITSVISSALYGDIDANEKLLERLAADSYLDLLGDQMNVDGLLEGHPSQ